jgi:hypothetical protein
MSTEATLARHLNAITPVRCLAAHERRQACRRSRLGILPCLVHRRCLLVPARLQLYSAVRRRASEFTSNA